MMKVKYYKCPVCNRKFKTLNGWGSHMTSEHPDTIPEGYSIARYFYYTVTGKTHGICRTCKAPTEWNENTMKYDQYCKDLKCKEAYAKIAKQRMIGKYGKVHLLNDPNQQKKMLEHRRISGKYQFQDGTEFGYVGSYEKEFLKMLDTMMNWHSNDLMAPSPHTYYYEYHNEKDDKANWGTKFYIPDFYIPSLNLEIEIKQTTSTNQEFIDIVREKEYLKDDVMKSNRDVNYLKITDKNFAPFFEFLLKAKENIPTDKEERTNTVGAIVEAYIPEVASEEIVEEGLVFNEKDLYINVDKFESGKSNVLLVTGFSGSGKTTLSENLAKKYRCENIALDCLSFYLEGHLSLENAKKYEPGLYDFINHKSLDRSREYNIYELYREYIKFIIDRCKKKSAQKFIIEGLQIYEFYEEGDTFITSNPLIIKGTSGLVSAFRAAKRNMEYNKVMNFTDKTFFKELKPLLKWVLKDNPSLNKLKSDMRNAKTSICIESNVDNTEPSLEAYRPSEIHDGFRVSYNVPKINKEWAVYDKDGTYNACVKVNGFDKPVRGRSEILIIKGDEVFLSFREDGSYQIPGGGWDKRESHKEAAIREAKEEVRINVEDVDYALTYMTYRDEPQYWVTRKVPSKKDWWYGGYTKLYVGSYDSEYDGYIKWIDRDTMAKTGRFYKIDDVYNKLLFAHRKAIDKYRENRGYVATEAMSPEEIGQMVGLAVVAGKAVGEIYGWGKKLFKSKTALKEKSTNLPSLVKVDIKNGYIEIRGINYRLLMERVQRFYIDKSINNIFNPVYNTLSYRKYERKQIQKKQIKIDYIATPEFFALELTKLFVELGERFRDKIYLRVAHKIYEESWLAQADKNTENTPILDTSKLSNLTLTLNNYQKEFIEKYPTLKAQLNLNGYILAFEQGLGKTLTAIGLSECIDVDHVYIVCPNSLKENWALEIKKYYEKYSDDKLWDREVFICNGKFGTYDKDTTKFFIVNNESIDKMLPYVLTGKNLLILDESHNFRNANAKRTQALLKLKDELKCSDTLIMSGTPIKATPSEIVPALLLIDPLFTVEAATIFTKAFKLKETLGSSLVQNRFGKVIYRKEKDVLENKLPEKHVMTIPVTIPNGDQYTLTKVNDLISKRYAEIYKDGEPEMRQMRDPFFKFTNAYHPPVREDKQRFDALVNYCVRNDSDPLDELDRDFINDYITSIKSTIKKVEDLKYFDFLVRNYLRYKQHCLGLAMGEILPKYRSQMFIDMYEQNKSTFHEEIKKSTKKTLIFSQFKSVVNYVHNSLNDHDIGAVMITGDVKDRLSILREFKENDNIRVLVATSQTIGTGVTLVEANQMYFFGPPWRSADFEQCSDRIHRIGQTEDVFIKTITLDTGKSFNLSSRMDTILAWSKKMTDAVIVTTDDNTDIDNTNFENMLVVMESSNILDTNDHIIMDILIAMESEKKENIINDFDVELKKIPSKMLKDIIEYRTGYHFIEARTTAFIPKNCVIEECSVDSPPGTHGKFGKMKFSELGGAVFATICDSVDAPVRFEYVMDNGHEYWNVVSNMDIKPGTVLSYSPKRELPSFAEEYRM